MNWSWRVFFTVIVVLGWIGFGYWFSSYTLDSPNRIDVVTIEVPPQSSLKSIGILLKKNGLIREAYFFRAYAIIKGRTNLKPGMYKILPYESLAQILDKLFEGRQDLIKIILPPGFTVMKLAERLEAHGFDKALFLRLMNDKKPRYDFERQIPATPGRTYRLDGYLCPGTYYFKKDEKMENIVNTMLERFGESLDMSMVEKQLRDNPDLPRGMTLDQIVTVASLIEREAQVRSELPIIAGVIYNRIRNPKNNRLQIDASIVYIYALAGKNLTSITQKQISSTKHLYNTYVYAGFPPGPISCPSKEALLAALHPQRHKYEYYVTKKDGSKQHYFAQTYEEHLRYDKLSYLNEEKLKKSR